MKRRVIKELGDPIVIEEVSSIGKDRIGSFHTGTGTIQIDANQPEIGKHIVVLHEILHLVDEQLVRAGITKRRITHRWIESAAPNLLLILTLAGFWKGVDRKKLLKFMAENMEGPPKKRKGKKK